MKIKGYEFPKSSFLSLEKDAAIIVKDLLSNNNLKKLLFYEDKKLFKSTQFKCGIDRLTYRLANYDMPKSRN